MDDVLGDRPVVSVSDALKGAMPGLQITGNSGRPGEEMSFNIRGVNSLDKNGKPLVLVDNVEMDINMLDPERYRIGNGSERCSLFCYLWGSCSVWCDSYYYQERLGRH